MRNNPPLAFPAYALCITLLSGGVTTGAASDRVINTMPSANEDFSLYLQSGAGGELPKNLFGDSVRMGIHGLPLTPSTDTLMASISCSESKDSLWLTLVEDSARAGTYHSQVTPIRRGSANLDGKLDCLEPDILQVVFQDPVYMDKSTMVVLIPGPISVRGPAFARAVLIDAHDRLLRGGDLASRPPQGIACFDVQGGFIGPASPLGAGVWRLPTGVRPAALRLRYPDGSSRHETVVNRR